MNNIISVDIGFNGSIIINNLDNEYIDIYKLNIIFHNSKKVYNLDKIYNYMLKYKNDNNILVIEEQTMFYKQAANISKFMTGYGIIIGLLYPLIENINKLHLIKPKKWQEYINNYYLNKELIYIIHKNKNLYNTTKTFELISDILPGLNKRIIHDLKLKSIKSSKILSMISGFYCLYNKYNNTNIDLMNKILFDDNTVDAFNLGNYYKLTNQL